MASGIYNTGGFIGQTSDYPSPSIINSGLLIHLDAGSSVSYPYPQTGATWNDLSGTNLTGTLTGSPTYDQRGFLNFNGSTQYVTHGSNAILALGTGDFTVEMWFNPSNNTQNSGLFQLSTSATYFTSTATNQLSAQLYLGYIQFGNNAGFNVGLNVAANAYVSNKWYHFVLRRISNTLNLYIDSVKVGGDTADSTNYTGTYLIWGGFFSASNLFLGSMATARLYKGKGLTASEILQNFNYSKIRFGL